MSESAMAAGGGQGERRAGVVHPALPPPPGGIGPDPDARLAEAVGLTEAIGLSVVAARAARVTRPRPATLLGGGQVDELAEVIRDQEIHVLVVDADLSPIQQRNLERAWACKVIDRTGLILEIFGERARTHEGRLQVELAALSYQRSRLVRSWTHLERQRGGLGFVGGPGESQLEIDRRLITDRIARLRRELEEVARTRGLHREARRRVPFPVVALVGYTNAGKSTLFNRLTGADVLARDQLFATLDPTMRGVDLPQGRRVILSDTVGFISDLPHDLVAAFRATLEEVQEADIIVHVLDISQPQLLEQRRDVEAVLRDLGLGARIDGGQVLEVHNKIDRLDAEEQERARRRLAGQPSAVAASALTGEGCAELLATLDRRLAAREHLATVHLPVTEGALMSWLYDHGEVIDRQDSDTCLTLTVRLAPDKLARLRQRVPADWLDGDFPHGDDDGDHGGG